MAHGPWPTREEVHYSINLIITPSRSSTQNTFTARGTVNLTSSGLPLEKEEDAVCVPRQVLASGSGSAASAPCKHCARMMCRKQGEEKHGLLADHAFSSDQLYSTAQYEYSTVQYSTVCIQSAGSLLGG